MANSQVGGATGGRATVFDTIAGSLLNVSLGQPPIAVDMPTPMKSSAGSLDDYVGDYRSHDGNQGPSFVVRAENEKLFTQGPDSFLQEAPIDLIVGVIQVPKVLAYPSIPS